MPVRSRSVASSSRPTRATSSAFVAPASPVFVGHLAICVLALAGSVLESSALLFLRVHNLADHSPCSPGWSAASGRAARHVMTARGFSYTPTPFVYGRATTVTQPCVRARRPPTPALNSSPALPAPLARQAGTPGVSMPHRTCRPPSAPRPKPPTTPSRLLGTP
jgi:hypothetical protein